jgi:hypothetical protein
MKRGQTCGRCEFLGPAQTVSFEAGLLWVCQHPDAVQTRSEEERMIRTEWSPHWCPQ